MLGGVGVHSIGTASEDGAMGVCFLFVSCLVPELRVGLGDSASARTSDSASPGRSRCIPLVGLALHLCGRNVC